MGDGANDIPMLKSVGLGIAYHGKDVVKMHISHQIKFTEIDSLLYLIDAGHLI